MIQTNICVVLLHIGANLINTYYDWSKGIDLTHVSNTDLQLVNGRVSSFGVLLLAVMCYCASIYSIWPIPIQGSDGATIYIVIVLLSFFYSAPPFGFKYKWCAEIVVFLCFGPLLTLFVVYLYTG